MTTTDPALDWLEYTKPFSAGLVVAPQALRELGLDQSLPQRATDSAVVAALLADGPSLPDPWAFFAGVLGWDAAVVAGAPGGPPLPDALAVRLPEHQTTLAPTYAVRERQGEAVQLLVRVEAPGVGPDDRGALSPVDSRDSVSGANRIQGCFWRRPWVSYQHALRLTR